MLITNREMNSHEKDKVRFKTIRYIERYCDIEKKCQICGKKAQIHHPDYKDYLKVNFLCKEHHTELHNLNLIPPKIIDLENIAIKQPKLENHKILVKENIEKIKEDILKNGKTFHDITKEYKTAQSTVKKFLTTTENEKLTRKSKENSVIKRKNRKIS